MREAVVGDAERHHRDRGGKNARTRNPVADGAARVFVVPRRIGERPGIIGIHTDRRVGRRGKIEPRKRLAEHAGGCPRCRTALAIVGAGVARHADRRRCLRNRRRHGPGRGCIRLVAVERPGVCVSARCRVGRGEAEETRQIEPAVTRRRSGDTVRLAVERERGSDHRDRGGTKNRRGDLTADGATRVLVVPRRIGERPGIIGIHSDRRVDRRREIKAGDRLAEHAPCRPRCRAALAIGRHRVACHANRGRGLGDRAGYRAAGRCVGVVAVKRPGVGVRASGGVGCGETEQADEIFCDGDGAHRQDLRHRIHVARFQNSTEIPRQPSAVAIPGTADELLIGRVAERVPRVPSAISADVHATAVGIGARDDRPARSPSRQIHGGADDVAAAAPQAAGIERVCNLRAVGLIDPERIRPQVRKRRHRIGASQRLPVNELPQIRGIPRVHARIHERVVGGDVGRRRRRLRRRHVDELELVAVRQPRRCREDDRCPRAGARAGR